MRVGPRPPSTRLRCFAAIEEIKSLEGLGLFLLQTAVSGTRGKQPAGYLLWESQCAKVASLAARQAQVQTRFRNLKRGNRSRGHWVYLLFAHLLEFWASRGGRVGKGAKSPSTLFVTAAASMALCQGRSCREAATRDCRFRQQESGLDAAAALRGFVGSEGDRTIRAPEEHLLNVLNKSG